MRIATKKQEREVIKKAKEIIPHIDVYQLAQVLAELVCKDAYIADAFIKEMDVHLAKADPEKIAGELFKQMNNLRIEDCWAASGDQYDGMYHDPGEVACEMLRAVHHEFFQEMIHLHALGCLREELIHVEGILLGLQRFNDESTSQIAELWDECSDVLADDDIRDWLKRHPEDSDLHQELLGFLNERTPDWERIFLDQKQRM